MEKHEDIFFPKKERAPNLTLELTNLTNHQLEIFSLRILYLKVVDTTAINRRFRKEGFSLSYGFCSSRQPDSARSQIFSTSIMGLFPEPGERQWES